MAAAPRDGPAGGPPHDIMKTSDILGDKFKTQRVTDPLNPVYHVNYTTIQDDASSRPRKLPTGKNAPFFSLYVDDIEGTKPGWKPPNLINPPLEQRRDFKRTNALEDIPGAQASTVKHTIQTQRITNPLEPDYVGLDGIPLEPVIPQYATLAATKRRSDGPAIPQHGEVTQRGRGHGMEQTGGGIFGTTGITRPSSSAGLSESEKDRKIHQLEKQLQAALSLSSSISHPVSAPSSSTPASSRPPLGPSSSRMTLDLSRTQQQPQQPHSRQGSAPATSSLSGASSSSRLVAAGGSATSGGASGRSSQRASRERDADIQSVRDLF